MTHWNDFNDAGQQAGFDLIPKGALVKVRMIIKPGGYDDAPRGWTGGWATESEQTGSVYLNAEFVVLDGQFAKRKMWSLIGLHSTKSDEWSNMGRAFLRAALNSARGVSPHDTSAHAQTARRIQHFGELDGLVFIARVDIEKDSRGDDRNAVRQAIEPDHKDYARLMSGAPTTITAAAPVVQTSHSASGAAARAPTAKPSWAQ